MKTIFKQIQFKTGYETRDTIQDSNFGFFVPGVNSGIYDPPTLHVQVLIQEKRAKLFLFRTVKTYASITLTPSQFDELFAEMEKIKQLRDSQQKINPKPKEI